MAQEPNRWTNEDGDIEIKKDPAPVFGPDQQGWLIIHESDLGAVDVNTGFVKARRSDFLRAEILGSLPKKPSV